MRMALMCVVAVFALITISNVYTTKKTNDVLLHESKKKDIVPQLLKYASDNFELASKTSNYTHATVYASYAIAYCNCVLLMLPNDTALKIRAASESIITAGPVSDVIVQKDTKILLPEQSSQNPVQSQKQLIKTQPRPQS
jgi:hypothetical protein